MNLVLFEPEEIDKPLPRADRRAAHILQVLGRGIGDSFDAGVINGVRAKATIAAISDESLTLTFDWAPDHPAPTPLTLVLGLPRPQTARDILRDATTLGATALHFIRTEKGESNYAQSTLWSSGEWRRHILAGAEQAFDTHVPEVTHGLPLADVLGHLPTGGTRLALDNYEAEIALGRSNPLALMTAEPSRAIVLAFGPERGWSAREREMLRSHHFVLAHLGSRVLRTETAVIAAVALVKSQLGSM